MSTAIKNQPPAPIEDLAEFGRQIVLGARWLAALVTRNKQRLADTRLQYMRNQARALRASLNRLPAESTAAKQAALEKLVRTKDQAVASYEQRTRFIDHRTEVLQLEWQHELDELTRRIAAAEGENHAG